MPKPNPNNSKKDSFLRNQFHTYHTSMTKDMGTLYNMIAENERKGTPLTGANAYLEAMFQLDMLRTADINIFGPDGTRVPSEAELRDYSKIVNDYVEKLNSIKNGLKDNVITNGDVRKICQRFLDENDEAISQEIRPYLNMKSQPQTWDITKEQEARIPSIIEESKKFVENKSKERVRSSAQASPARGTGWKEYPGVHDFSEDPNDIPMALQLSGDINELASYYIQYESVLSPETKDYLKGHIGTIAYYNDLEKTSKENPSEPVFDVKETGNGVQLDGYQNKYQYQTTGMGCWSCAYAMLLESRGVSLNQQMIRSFRPNAVTNDLADSPVEKVSGIVSDLAYSPLENADLTLKLLPNTAMRQFATGIYNPEDEDDVKAVKSVLKETITDAIRNHKSPVAITNGTHFLTIVGMDGDNFTALNSLGHKEGLQDDDRELEAFIKDNHNLSLTFVQDLSFDKDGKCTNMPEQFGARYNGGKLVDIGVNLDVLNRSGNTFGASREVGKLQMHESIYLPTSVPENIYTRTAEKEAEAENIAPKQEEVKQEVPKVEEPKREEDAEIEEEPKVEGPQNQEQKVEGPQNQEQKVEGPQNQDPKVEEPNQVAPQVAPEQKVEEPNQAAPEPKAPEQARDIAKEMQDEADAARAQIGNIARDGEKANPDDRLADPAGALKQTVAMLLTYLSLLDAYNQSDFPNKDQIFARLIDSQDTVRDIANSKSFNDFYSSLNQADFEKFAKGTPQEAKEVEDRLYKQYADTQVGRSRQSAPKKVAGPKPTAKKNGTVKLKNRGGHELRYVAGRSEKMRKKIAKAEERKAEAKARAEERAKANEEPEKVDPALKMNVPKVEQTKVEQPKVEQPKVEQPKVEQPKVEQPKVEQPKVEEPKVEQPKVEQPKVEEPKVEPAKEAAEQKPEENAAPKRPAKPKRSIKNVSPAQRVMSAQIDEAHKQIGEVIKNWDSLADPNGALKMSVASLLAYRTMQDAYMRSKEPDKEERYAKLANSRDMVYDIAESRSFNDFFVPLRKEELAKFGETDRAVSKQIEDEFYNKYADAMEKAAEPKGPENAPEDLEVGKDWEVLKREDLENPEIGEGWEELKEEELDKPEIGEGWEELKEEELDNPSIREGFVELNSNGSVVRDIDTELDAKIVDAYKRIGNVLKDGEKANPDERLADPEGALKYAVGSMLAYKTMEEAYMNSQDPDKDEVFGDMLDNESMVRDTINSKLFNDFYATLSKEDLEKFKGEEDVEVDDELYKKFSEFDKQPRKNVEEPKVEEPKVEQPKVEEPKVENAEAPKVDNVEQQKVEEQKVEEAPKVDNVQEQKKVEPKKAEQNQAAPEQKKVEPKKAEQNQVASDKKKEALRKAQLKKASKGLHEKRTVIKGPANKDAVKKPEKQTFKKNVLFTQQVAADQKLLQDRAKKAFEDVREDLAAHPEKVKNPDDTLKENIARMVIYQGLLEKYNIALFDKKLAEFGEKMNETAVGKLITNFQKSDFLDEFIKKMDDTAVASVTADPKKDPEKAAGAQEKFYKRLLIENNNYRKNAQKEQQKAAKEAARKRKEEIKTEQPNKQQVEKKQARNFGPHA